ncbi:unnamed protein product [Lampetra fluviatilis]
MSAVENSTTTFYELMINNNHHHLMINNNHNNNHHHRESLQNGEDAVAFDASPAASHAAWRRAPTRLLGRVRGHRRALGPNRRAAAARKKRRARNAASRRGHNRAHVPQPALLPTPPAPAKTSDHDDGQWIPPPLPPTYPAPRMAAARREIRARNDATGCGHNQTNVPPPPLPPNPPALAKTVARDAGQRGIPSLMSIVTSPAGTGACDGYHGQRPPLLVTPPRLPPMRSPELVLRCGLPVHSAHGVVGVPAVTLQTSRRGSGIETPMDSR